MVKCTDLSLGRFSKKWNVSLKVKPDKNYGPQSGFGTAIGPRLC